MRRIWILGICAMSFLLASCGDKEADATTQKVNQFIETAMSDMYLWSDQIPDLDTRYEFDSKAYFDKLLYEDDKWSFITDDIQALENSFEGVEKSFGYSLTFNRFTNAKTHFAIVEYVYPNTPAAEAGMKRGDIIVKVNSEDITADNYMNLLTASQVQISLGTLTGSGIGLSGEVRSMNSKELNLDPVLQYQVIDISGHRVGYLLYAQFISNYDSSVDAAFQYFASQNITDLVVDIRYNPGGMLTAAQHLCSEIAPASVVNSKQVLATLQWNNDYQEYWTSHNITNQTIIAFDPKVPVNLNLNQVYMLTGPGSASASELTICGLKPYMSVVLVGDTTYGKYTASITITPSDYDSSASAYSDIDNWGIQPIIARYANALGVTDFKDGFAPDFYVEDDLLSGVPLGDKYEPLFNQALKLITGSEIIAMKSARVKSPTFEIIGRGFSRFDQNKRNLLIDDKIVPFPKNK